jgi:hypothetical protein
MPKENVVALRGRRPLSVWILCLVNGAMAVVLIATAILSSMRGWPGGTAVFYGVAGIALSISAHATWFGYRWGRLALLVVLTALMGLMIAYSGWIIAWSLDNNYVGDDYAAAWLRAIAALAWLAVNIIFLFRKPARMFFG